MFIAVNKSSVKSQENYSLNFRLVKSVRRHKEKSRHEILTCLGTVRVVNGEVEKRKAFKFLLSVEDNLYSLAGINVAEWIFKTLSKLSQKVKTEDIDWVLSRALSLEKVTYPLLKNGFIRHKTNWYRVKDLVQVTTSKSSRAMDWNRRHNNERKAIISNYRNSAKLFNSRNDPSANDLLDDYKNKPEKLYGLLPYLFTNDKLLRELEKIWYTNPGVKENYPLLVRYIEQARAS